MNNDLKSSEALKAYAREVLCGNNPTNSLLIRMFDEIIDKAPPAEPEKVLIANVTFDKDQLEQIIRDRVIEPIKNGELVLQTDKRPKGEWIITYSEKKKKVNKCRVCGFISIQGKTNFCPNCGLPMKKGGAE